MDINSVYIVFVKRGDMKERLELMLRNQNTMKRVFDVDLLRKGSQGMYDQYMLEDMNSIKIHYEALADHAESDFEIQVVTAWTKNYYLSLQQRVYMLFFILFACCSTFIVFFMSATCRRSGIQECCKKFAPCCFPQ